MGSIPGRGTKIPWAKKKKISRRAEIQTWGSPYVLPLSRVSGYSSVVSFFLVLGKKIVLLLSKVNLFTCVYDFCTLPFSAPESL